MSISDSRYHLRNSHHPKGTRIMTDNTIPVEKIQEIIDLMNSDLKTPAFDDEWGEGYDRAVVTYKFRLEALLPKPRTLADELRALADGEERIIDANLHALADRAETLEQEHDAAVKELKDPYSEINQEAGAWRTAAEHPLIGRIHELPPGDSYAKQVKARLDEIEKAAAEKDAEIARLRAREIPDGWSIAEHPENGTVLAAETPCSDGYTHYVWMETSIRDLIYSGWGAPDELSFRDEAPAPQQEMDAR